MTEKQLDDLKSQLSEISDNLSKVVVNQETQSERLDKVESAVAGAFSGGGLSAGDDHDDFGHVVAHGDKLFRAVSGRSGLKLIPLNKDKDSVSSGDGGHTKDSNPSLLQAVGGFAEAGSLDDLDYKVLQDKYTSICDGFSKVKLPGEYLLSKETGAGIQSDDRPKFNILTKGSKYLETALKWVKDKHEKYEDEDFDEDLEELSTILLAAQSYFREEIGICLVNAKAKGAGKYYRALRTHRGTINTEDARAAFEFQKAASQDTSSKPRGRGGKKPWFGNRGGNFSAGRGSRPFKPGFPEAPGAARSDTE